MHSFLALPSVALLALPQPRLAVGRVRKGLLDGGPRLTRNIQLGKLWAHQQNVDAGRIEDLLRGRDRRCKVRVLGQSRYEEHEATCFDLHLGEVGAAGGDAGVFPEKDYELADAPKNKGKDGT